jgi:hypothetical protein
VITTPRRLTLCGIVFAVLVLSPAAIGRLAASAKPTRTRLGVDVDFYTGPVSKAVWLRMKSAGQRFVVAQAWGGRSRNELAESQLNGARTIGRMATAAYVLLNYDDRVCATFAQPRRNEKGACGGGAVDQPEPGGRWQVRQGLKALGAELRHVRFVAIDVEWFLSSPPPSDSTSAERRRTYLVDAIDEVRRAGKKAVVYTRNVKRHWSDITGCRLGEEQPECSALYRVIQDPVAPVPLWDVETGDPDLGNFQPHSAWSNRAGRQYGLDRNLFGLPAHKTVDLNVFDASLFDTNRTRGAVQER